MHPNVHTRAGRLAVQDIVANLLWQMDRRRWRQVAEYLAESAFQAPG
jgi:hypothetical protein